MKKLKSAQRKRDTPSAYWKPQQFKNLLSGLGNAFWWNETREGFNYWLKIYNRLEELAEEAEKFRKAKP